MLFPSLMLLSSVESRRNPPTLDSWVLGKAPHTGRNTYEISINILSISYTSCIMLYPYLTFRKRDGFQPWWPRAEASTATTHRGPGRSKARTRDSWRSWGDNMVVSIFFYFDFVSSNIKKQIVVSYSGYFFRVTPLKRLANPIHWRQSNIQT